MNKRTINRLIWTINILLLSTVFLSHSALALEIHQNIHGPFNSSGDVTTACLECHHQQALEVLQSTHWTWVRQRTINGRNTLFGKKESLTGFAIDVSSNPSRCLGCHISNTRPEVNLDTPGPEMVDCLVCHDTTGTYHLTNPDLPVEQSSENFELMARNVGTPTPANCMSCHFADCGLPATDPTAVNSRKNSSAMQDFHIKSAKISFTCQTCHIRHSGHGFSRKIVKNNGTGSKQGCESCHTKTPHTMDPLNLHMAKIACQTCHIPQYAQQEPVVISWNWIMTGKTNRVYQSRPGGHSLVQDENGFTSATQLEPVYFWDDGSDLVYTRGQRIKPQALTFLQKPSEKNSMSKIAPFRVIYGTQMYDSKYRYLISPLLRPTGSSFFPDSDWEKIAKEGMESIVLPFSGQYAFAPTAILRRINHGIAPIANALGCVDCHGSKSRMPWKDLGYDQDPWAEKAQSITVSTEPPTAIRSKLQPIKKPIVPLGPTL